MAADDESPIKGNPDMSLERAGLGMMTRTIMKDRTIARSAKHVLRCNPPLNAFQAPGKPPCCSLDRPDNIVDRGFVHATTRHRTHTYREPERDDCQRSSDKDEPKYRLRNKEPATPRAAVRRTQALGFDPHRPIHNASIRIVSRFAAKEKRTRGAIDLNHSLEFALAVQCCRLNFAGTDPAEKPRLPSGIDWRRLIRLVSFHRIEGLAWNALSRIGHELPSDPSLVLEKAAADIAIRNLRAVAKSTLLLKEFDAANLALLFLKGASLGSLAYSNPSLKSAIDIDILIDRFDLVRSEELLGKCGFRLTLPAERNIEKWHDRSKESVWTCDLPPLQLDLHTRVVDNQRLVPSIDVHSPFQIVGVGNGVRLPTLAFDELVAYLSVHGASSAWFRMKWISDFAGLVQGRTADEFEQLYRRSQELGAGRCAGQALLLADALFSTLEPAPALRERLSRDRAIVGLYRSALKFLSSEKGEPTGRRLGTFTIHQTQFSLLPGLSFKASELLRQAGRFLDRLR